MKNLQLVVIWIGFITGSCFFLSQIFTLQFFVGLFIATLCSGISGVIGFLTVRWAPIRKGGKHIAILAPWLPMFLLFLISGFKPTILFFTTVGLPLLLVFASIGGVIAFRAKQNEIYRQNSK